MTNWQINRSNNQPIDWQILRQWSVWYCWHDCVSDSNCFESCVVRRLSILFTIANDYYQNKQQQQQHFHAHHRHHHHHNATSLSLMPCGRNVNWDQQKHKHAWHGQFYEYFFSSLLFCYFFFFFKSNSSILKVVKGYRTRLN